MVYTVSKEFQRESAFLVALNQGDGTVRWATELQNVPNIFSPVVYDEKLYLTAGNSLSVFDAETGEKVLEEYFDVSVSSNAVFSQGNIFVSLSNGNILKIDPETAEYTVIYRAPFGTQFAVVGSSLYIPLKGARNALVTIDAESGKILNRIDTPFGEPSALTISKGILFLPTEERLMAIGEGELVKATSRVRREQTDKRGVAEEGKLALRGGGSPESGPLREEEGQKQLEQKDEKTSIEKKAREGETETGKSAEPGEETGKQDEKDTATITGELKDRDTGKPLSGSVEATTELESGKILKKEEMIDDGRFALEVPKDGQTDLIFSSPGYTFETITLPDEKAIDDLSLEPLELSLSRVKKGETLKFESIQYKISSANLEQSSLGTLDKLLSMMKDNPQIKIEIAGHTDSTGSKEFNMKLSWMRSESVADWLIRNGISSKRIVTKGYGDTKPVADNTTDEGRRKNRRTEILIIDD
jgi:outer membrane protein OmpA-like peptidoglycan-associated protein